MALTNLFEMVKADRYTQDGRDKINEAQKEVEDVRYKIGDISQKTGLRKTAEGWVDPKTGQKPKGTKKPNKNDSIAKKEEIGEEIKGNLNAAKYYFNKAQSFSTTDPSYKTYMLKAKEYNDKAKVQANENAFDWEEMHNRGITQAVEQYASESNGAENKQSNDMMSEMRNTDTPVRTAHSIINRGDLDNAITESAGDSETMEDIARDLLSPAFESLGEIPSNYLKNATDSLQKRYKLLEGRATR